MAKAGAFPVADYHPFAVRREVPHNKRKQQKIPSASKLASGLAPEVFFAENSEEYNRREFLCVEGEINKIVLPMWVGLKRFLSYSAVEPHWPEVSSTEVSNLCEFLEKEVKIA